jgi:uncharacterized protein (DUF2249 family)
MEHCLDVSELEPPEPLERILDALADLPQGDWLHVLHRREPFPLYRMLHDMGYRWYTRTGPEAGIEMFVWEADAPVPPEIAQEVPLC